MVSRRGLITSCSFRGRIPDSSDELGQLIGGPLETVVDDHMLELVPGAELSPSDLEPLLDLPGGVAATPDEPGTQSLEGWRRDEHLESVGERGPHLPRSLHLDLQHEPADAPGGVVASGPRSRALDLRAGGAVAVARVGRVLQERVGGDPPLELLGRQEPVVAPVDLARTLRPCRGRDRKLEPRKAFAQGAYQRALPDPRRAGDDEYVIRSR